jgi:hypothetical protein
MFLQVTLAQTLNLQVNFMIRQAMLKINITNIIVTRKKQNTPLVATLQQAGQGMATHNTTLDKKKHQFYSDGFLKNLCMLNSTPSLKIFYDFPFRSYKCSNKRGFF